MLFPQNKKLWPLDLLSNTDSDVTSCNLNNLGIQVRNLFDMVQGLKPSETFHREVSYYFFFHRGSTTENNYKEAVVVPQSWSQ